MLCLPTMSTDTQRIEYVTRDVILKLLSDAEIAQASTKEAGRFLVEGDEYVDLGHLNYGVRRVHGSTQLALNDLLPRSAVAAKTWTKICARLAEAKAGLSS